MKLDTRANPAPDAAARPRCGRERCRNFFRAPAPKEAMPELIHWLQAISARPFSRRPE